MRNRPIHLLTAASVLAVSLAAQARAADAVAFGDIHNLPIDHAERSRYLAARDALEARFKGRILSVDNRVVRRWGVISGMIKRETRVAPSVIDTLLAATAIENEMFLVTRAM